MEPNPYEPPRCKPSGQDGAGLIDVARRTVLADGTHEYLAGMLTNFEFERRLHATDLPVFGAPRPHDDPVLSPMVQRLWLICYVHGDLDEYRLTNEHKLPTKSRREVLRWILFLRSDRPYEWPQFQCLADLNRNAGLIHPLLSLLTLGYWGRVQRETFRREAEQFMLAGDHGVWPFKRREDFQAALAESCPIPALAPCDTASERC